MLLDFRKQMLDEGKALGKEVNLDVVEETNEKINEKIRQGFNKNDVVDYFMGDLYKTK